MFISNLKHAKLHKILSSVFVVCVGFFLFDLKSFQTTFLVVGVLAKKAHHYKEPKLEPKLKTQQKHNKNRCLHSLSNCGEVQYWAGNCQLCVELMG